MQFRGITASNSKFVSSKHWLATPGESLLEILHQVTTYCSDNTELCSSHRNSFSILPDNMTYQKCHHCRQTSQISSQNWRTQARCSAACEERSSKTCHLLAIFQTQNMPNVSSLCAKRNACPFNFQNEFSIQFYFAHSFSSEFPEPTLRCTLSTAWGISTCSKTLA